jgi:hypothetical protein
MNGEAGHRASDYGRREVEAARRVIAEIYREPSPELPLRDVLVPVSASCGPI